MWVCVCLSPQYSKKLARKLWKAVWDDDINKVKDLLQQGANSNHKLYWTKEWSQCKDPPLHTACWKGNLEIVKMLLNNGAGIDKGGGEYNRIPLHFASGAGHLHLVDYLIREAGCRVGKLQLFIL